MRKGKPSSTANLIAHAIVLASHDRELSGLVAKDESELILRILGKSQSSHLFHFSLKTFPLKLRLLERFLLPGIIAHYLVRKRKIEQMVRNAIASGTQEVVVIAAGYDTLCLRLSQEFPEIRFVEIDHPETQASKKAAFPERSNLRYAACDLTKEPLPALSENPSRMIVLEGLTMYLHEKQVATLFNELSLKCSALIFTFMEKAANGSIRFRNQSSLIDRWLSWKGENFYWGITRDSLSKFLGKQGLHNVSIVDYRDLRTEFLEPLDLHNTVIAQGECICLTTPISK